MDRNLVLAIALSFLVLSLWTMWTEKHKPHPQPPREVAEGEAETGTAAGGAESPGAADRFPALPGAASAPAPVAAETGHKPAPPTTSTAPAEPEQTARSVEIDRPLFQARLTSRGAAIESWELTEYTDPKGANVLVIPEPSRAGALAVTAFLELGQGDLSQAIWSIDHEDANEVAFSRVVNGITLRKVFKVDEDGYSMRMHIEVSNGSQGVIAPR